MSDAEIAAFLTSFSRLDDTALRPRVTAASSTSMIVTASPATAQVCAMPPPMVPAPMTPIVCCDVILDVLSLSDRRAGPARCTSFERSSMACLLRWNRCELHVQACLLPVPNDIDGDVHSRLGANRDVHHVLRMPNVLLSDAHDQVADRDSGPICRPIAVHRHYDRALTA